MSKKQYNKDGGMKVVVYLFASILSVVVVIVGAIFRYEIVNAWKAFKYWAWGGEKTAERVEEDLSPGEAPGEDVDEPTDFPGVPDGNEDDGNWTKNY